MQDLTFRPASLDRPVGVRQLSSPARQLSAHSTVAVIGSSVPPGVISSLRKFGVTVVLAATLRDLAGAFEPECIVVCADRRNDMAVMQSSASHLKDVPVVLMGAGERGSKTLVAEVSAAMRSRQESHAVSDAERFRILAEAGRSLLSSDRPAAFMHQLFENLTQQLGIDFYLNYLVDENTGRLHLHSYRGLSHGSARELEWLNVGQAVCGTAVAGNKRVVLSNVQESPSPLTSLIKSLGIRAYACFPLCGSPAVRGTVSFGCRTRASFAATELDLMSGIADLAGVALERFQLLDELKRKNRILENSNRDLEEFAYAVTHDLKEPLRSVSSFTELLERRCQGLGEEEAQLIRFIKSGAGRMSELIDAVLGFSRAHVVTSACGDLVDMGRLVQEVIENLAESIRGADAVVTVEKLPHVAGDRMLLLQLVQNLIANAVKYRGAEQPRIHIGCADHNGSPAFFVRDNGIGIERSAHQTIFGIFKRLHSHEKYSGAGIGLSVAKKIVDHHGGRIWVDSHPGEGSTFWFTLVANAAAA